VPDEAILTEAIMLPSYKTQPILTNEADRLSESISAFFQSYNMVPPAIESLFPLENIIHRAFDAIVLINERQQILYFSEGAESLFQYQKQEVMGQFLDILVTPRFREAHHQHIKTFVAGEEMTRPAAGKFRVVSGVRRDGTEFLAQATIAKTKESPLIMAVFLRDVTEWVEKEKAVQEAARFSQATLDAQAAHICVLDENGIILAVNKAWREYAAANGGDPVKVSIGINYLEIAEGSGANPSEDGLAFARGIRSVLDGETKRFTMEYPCHSLTEQQWFLGQVTRFPENGPTRIVVVHENVTQRKTMEDALLQAQKLESLGVFAAGVAHDFNNILTAILAQSSLALLELASASKTRSRLETIIQISEQAATITRQLLSYAGKGQKKKEAFCLNDKIVESLPLLQLIVPKHIGLQTNLTTNFTQIMMPPGDMQQVLMNFVLNAAEAYEGHVGTIIIESSVEELPEINWPKMVLKNEQSRPGRYICLTIRDKGKGMDEATRAHVFDPFFTTKTTGRGLGLAVVLGVIHSAKGFIALESELGMGTVFRIYLPSTKVVNKATPLNPGKTEKPVSTGTILLVDDEERIRQSLDEFLRLSDFRVISTGDGHEAVRLFEQHRDSIHLIILDLMMPVVNGQQVFRQIRQLKPDVPIILSSGYDEEFTSQLSMEHVAFLHKPFRFETLIATIQQML
jgi:PAS domain S-box-containing protein